MGNVIVLTAAVAELTAVDRRRAAMPLPGHNFKWKAEDITPNLNDLLQDQFPGDWRPCQEFSLTELHDIYVRIYKARDLEYDGYYAEDDNRILRLKTIQEVASEHADDLFTVTTNSTASRHVKAGTCAEIDMMYTHHLNAASRGDLGNTKMPLMDDEFNLEFLAGTDGMDSNERRRYRRRGTCDVCHRR